MTFRPLSFRYDDPGQPMASFTDLNTYSNTRTLLEEQIVGPSFDGKGSTLCSLQIVARRRRSNNMGQLACECSVWMGDRAVACASRQSF